MFQFRRFPSYTYFVQYRIPCGGFPHSEISGSLLICSSPKLIAAYHVLHRLLMPRHSPCALFSLTVVEARVAIFRKSPRAFRSGWFTPLPHGFSSQIKTRFAGLLICWGNAWQRYCYRFNLVTSRIIHFYLVSLVELCRLIKEVSLAKIVIITLLIKSFPLLLPSHNCINNSQCSVFKVHSWASFSRDSMKPQIPLGFQSISY